MSDRRELVRAMYDKVMGVSDLDWSELAEKYECGLHPDHLRKMGAGTTTQDCENGMIITGVGKVSMVIRHMMNGAFLCSLFRYRPAPSGGEMDSTNCALMYQDGTPTKTYFAFEKHQTTLAKLARDGVK